MHGNLQATSDDAKFARSGGTSSNVGTGARVAKARSVRSPIKLDPSSIISTRSIDSIGPSATKTSTMQPHAQAPRLEDDERRAPCRYQCHYQCHGRRLLSVPVKESVPLPIISARTGLSG